jgi:hypothetical protein
MDQDKSKQIADATGPWGEELAERIAQIDPELLITVTVGSKETDAPDAPRIAGDFFTNFRKAGDGFVNVFGKRPVM